MNTDSYSLIDGEQMNLEHPDTFWMPDLADRRALQRGDIVKLMFDPIGDGITERMWVRVLEPMDADGVIVGELDAVPVFDDKGIDIGDIVRFEPRHVIDIYEPEPSIVIDERARAAMVGALQRHQKKVRARRA